MASQFFVQYLDSDNKLIQKNISSNSASELEREISDKGGEVLSVVEKKYKYKYSTWRSRKAPRKNKFHSTIKDDAFFRCLIGPKFRNSCEAN